MRLEEDTPTKKSQDPITTSKLEDIPQSVQEEGSELILKADRSQFGCVIVMAQGCSLNWKASYSFLGQLTWDLTDYCEKQTKQL